MGPRQRAFAFAGDGGRLPVSAIGFAKAVEPRATAYW
jgi:hypothetical protein